MNAYAKIFLLRCREATALASEGYERTLDRPERIALGVHTILCRPCRRFRRQVGVIHRALERIGDDPEALPAESSPTLPTDVRERFRRALDQARGDR